MRRLALAAAIAATLTGCAATQNAAPTPSFDFERQAAIAPGYPLEYLQAPSPLRLSYADYESHQRLPHGDGSVSERGFVWSTGSDGTAVMAAIFRQANRATFQPSTDNRQRTVINDLEVMHMTETGRYFDLVFWNPAIPAGSPRCAVGTALSITSADRQREVAGEYVEGLSCDAAENLTQEERQAHQQRAFQAFGLR